MAAQKALRELVDEFEPRLSDFARAYADAVLRRDEGCGTSCPDRDAVVSEAADWIAESLPKLRELLATKTRSLINAARYQERKRRAHAAADLPDPRGDRRVMAELQQAVTWAAQDRLTDQNRAIFQGRRDGKTVAEIAAEHSLSVSTVHKRLEAIVSFLERVFLEQERTGKRFSVEAAGPVPETVDAYPPPNRRCEPRDAVTFVLLGEVMLIADGRDVTSLYAAHLPACPRCERATAIVRGGIESALEAGGA